MCGMRKSTISISSRSWTITAIRAHELPGGVAVQASDLGRLSVLRGIEDAFSRQLDLIKALAQRFGGRMRMATTVFNAWTTLRT